MAALVSHIIPTDTTPGAQEAGIAGYLEDEAEKSDKLRKLYDSGLQDLNRKSQTRFGSSFVRTTYGQQEHLLEEIANSEFFKSVRNLTVRHFYSSQVGWQSIGYPGMGQPHGYRDFDLAPGQSRNRPSEMDSEMMLPEGKGRKEVAASCGQCHELSVVTSQRKTKEEWQRTVRKMVTQYHASFDPSLADKIVSYLSQKFGAD